MAPVVIWTLVALVTAAVVLVVAGAAGGRSGGLRQFVEDLRAGLRRDGRGRRGGILADARRDHAEAADAEPGTVEDLFAIGRPQESAYVEPHELTGTLSRAFQGVTATVRR